MKTIRDSGMIRALWVCAMVLIGWSAEAAVIFSDGFESGDGSAWPAKRGQDSYTTENCHSGRYCGAMTLTGGSPQQSVLWEKPFTHGGSQFYMGGWYRFPAGYSWDPAPGANSTEHKMFIVSVGDTIGRILLNLRGGGTSPTLQVHFERLEGQGGISQYTNTQWPSDGQWHYLEILVDRVSGPGGRARIWLDGRSALDATGAVCSSPCAPVVGVQVGAFVNQGSVPTQTFFMDDIVLATERTGAPTPPPADTTPPTVSISEPAGGTTVSGSRLVRANASDNIGVAGVQFKLDGADLGAEDTAAPYELSWNTAQTSNGSHALTAVARDAAGNRTTSAGVTVTVGNTSTPPDGSVLFSDGFESGSASAWNAFRGNITYPNSGCRTGNSCGALHLAGGGDQQSVLWEKAFGYGGEKFYVSGWWRFPQGHSWDRPAGSSSSFDHKMMIINPSNGIGRTHLNLRGGGTSPSLAVVFERTLPDQWEVGNGLRWPTDGGWHRLELELTRVPGQNARARVWLDGNVAIDVTRSLCGDSPCSSIEGIQIGAYVNQGSVNNQTFYMDDIVVATGRVAGSPTPPPPSDTTAPTVSISEPVNGTTVSGARLVRANASDNVGVAGVQFKLDGADLGAEDTAAPYELSWNTAQASNGGHTLTAVARDAAGNRTTSTGVAVTVSNAVTPPPPPAPGVAVDSTYPGYTAGSIDDGVVNARGGEAATWASIEDPSAAHWVEVTFPSSRRINTAGIWWAFNAVQSKLMASQRVEVQYWNGSAYQTAATLLSGGADLAVTSATFAAVETTRIRYYQPAGQGHPNYSEIMWLTELDYGFTEQTTPPPPPPPTPGVVLLQEDFENSSFGTRGWYDNTTPVLSTVERRPGSTRSLENRFPQGGDKPVNGGAMRKKFTPSDTVHLTYHVKHSGNWVGSQRPYHPHIFYFLTNKDGDFSGLSRNPLTAYVEQVNGIPMLSVQDAANIDHQKLRQDLTGVTEQRAVAGCNGNIPGASGVSCYDAGGGVYANGTDWKASTVYFADETGPRYKGDWHRVDATFKLNSVVNNKGVADGYVRYAYDGVEVFKKENLILRTGVRADMKFDKLVIAPYIGDGSPVEQSFWIDDLVVTDGTPAGPAPDVTAPAVSISDPRSGETISGTKLVRAAASDNVGVAGVQFKLNGTDLGAEDTSAPYELGWNTAQASNGNHVLTAVARDAAGNRTTSAGVSVTVNNTVTPPPPPPPTAGIAVDSTYAGYTVSSVDDGAVDARGGAATTWASQEDPTAAHWVEVTFPAARRINTAGIWWAYNAFQSKTMTSQRVEVQYWNGSAYQTAATLLSGGAELAVTSATFAAVETTRIRYYQPAGQGHPSYSEIMWLTELDYGSTDVTPPAVSISTPTNGATLAGTRTVRATATDDAGVAGVQFKLDGADLGAEDTSAPYELGWNTVQASNGNHILTAVARDAAGNRTTSAGITVTVNNTAVVAVDSTYAGYTVSSVDNGIVDARGGTATTWASQENPTAAHWVELTFPVARRINTAGIWWAYNAFQSKTMTSQRVEVQYWNGSAYQTAATLLSGGAELAVTSATFAAVETTRIRYYQPAGQGHPNYSEIMWLTELDYGSTDVTPPAADLTRPTVTITAPAGGATVSGSRAFTADATDNAGVAGVLFLVDGQEVSAEDAAQPYGVTWDTTRASNGLHTLVARARDAAGNTSEASVTVTVSNAATPPPPSGGNVIFSDGFESGNGSAWPAKRGQDSYTTQNCHSGRYCGAMTLTGGAPQQSVLWEKSFTHGGSQFYMGGWYRFPAGYSWDPAPGANSTEHKMFIISVGDTIGRVLLNLRGGGTSPTLQVHFERLEGQGGISQYTNTQWPADGQWHHLEILIDRVSGRGGRARIWLDGQSALDATGAVCASPCSPVVGVQVGAFVNQGSQRTQTFYMDDIVLGSGRVTGGATGQPLAVGQSTSVAPRAAGTFTADGQLEAVVSPQEDISELRVERLSPERLGASKALYVYSVSAPGRGAALGAPGTVVLYYPDADQDGRVDGLKVPERSLRIFFHDGAAWRFMGGTVDEDGNRVSTPMTRFGVFGLFPAAGTGSLAGAQKFLSPGLKDGINDLAIFGPEAEEVTIHDAKGREVFKAERSGDAPILWSCVDGSGRPVESGVYIARVRRADGSLEHQTITVVK